MQDLGSKFEEILGSVCDKAFACKKAMKGQRVALRRELETAETDLARLVSDCVDSGNVPQVVYGLYGFTGLERGYVSQVRESRADALFLRRDFLHKELLSKLNAYQESVRSKVLESFEACLERAEHDAFKYTKVIKEADVTQGVVPICGGGGSQALSADLAQSLKSEIVYRMCTNLQEKLQRYFAEIKKQDSSAKPGVNPVQIEFNTALNDLLQLDENLLGYLSGFFRNIGTTKGEPCKLKYNLAGIELPYKQVQRLLNVHERHGLVAIEYVRELIEKQSQSELQGFVYFMQYYILDCPNELYEWVTTVKGKKSKLVLTRLNAEAIITEALKQSKGDLRRLVEVEVSKAEEQYAEPYMQGGSKPGGGSEKRSAHINPGDTRAEGGCVDGYDGEDPEIQAAIEASLAISGPAGESHSKAATDSVRLFAQQEKSLAEAAKRGRARMRPGGSRW